MESLKKNIETKIKKNFEIIDLKIIDNSGKHKGHKFFSPERYHLKLIIKSEYLKSLPLIKAQKQVMNILNIPAKETELVDRMLEMFPLAANYKKLQSKKKKSNDISPPTPNFPAS